MMMPSRPTASSLVALLMVAVVPSQLQLLQQGSFVVVQAYAPSFVVSTRRASRALGASSSSSSSSSSIRMDLECPETTLATARWQLEQLLSKSGDGEASTSSSRRHFVRPTVDEEQARHGMPWQQSIDPTYEDNELLYMKFWEWHLRFMKDNLTNLKVEECRNHKNTHFDYRENAEKKARIVSMCLSSDEYRKIRLTYYDAGNNAQVFNAVLYPRAEYDLPILGVDVLAFNRKKYLAIVDFQPLHDDESDHALPYEHLLQPIKAQYDNLKGQMSSKFYDETQFFSQQMLFSRFENEAIVHDELFPAFQEYVKTHAQLIRDTPADSANAHKVMERQEAYDKYSAERDPATGLFSAMFGNDWAQEFVHDFLFSLSRKSSTSEQKVEEPSSRPAVEGDAATGSSSKAAPSLAAPAPKAFVASSRRRR